MIAEAVLANETNKVCFEIDFSNKSISLTRNIDVVQSFNRSQNEFCMRSMPHVIFMVIMLVSLNLSLFLRFIKILSEKLDWVLHCLQATPQSKNSRHFGQFFFLFVITIFWMSVFFCFLLNFCFFVKITRGTRARTPPWICFFAKRSTPNAGPCFTDHTHTLVASSTHFLRVFRAAFSNQNQAARWPSWASKALPSRRVWQTMRFQVLSFKG